MRTCCCCWQTTPVSAAAEAGVQRTCIGCTLAEKVQPWLAQTQTACADRLWQGTC